LAPNWLKPVEPLAQRLLGHRQVTEALLGLAIRSDGVLVTLDRQIQPLAGPEFQRNLLTLA
jgi:hypothetical protein